MGRLINVQLRGFGEAAKESGAGVDRRGQRSAQIVVQEGATAIRADGGESAISSKLADFDWTTRLPKGPARSDAEDAGSTLLAQLLIFV